MAKYVAVWPYFKVYDSCILLKLLFLSVTFLLFIIHIYFTSTFLKKKSHAIIMMDVLCQVHNVASQTQSTVLWQVKVL